MAYIGNQPTDNFVTFATQNFSTSATSSYTLSHSVSNENEIALFINNVRQHPGSGKAYTASGTALTLSANTASTDVMYCIFLGRAIQSTVPATNSITAAMMFSSFANGITQADQWRLTANIDGTNAVITANLAQVSGAVVGSGMSESSGIFTFPETGVYLIIARLEFSAIKNDDNVFLSTNLTTDNSNYSQIDRPGVSNPDSSAAAESITIGISFVDITNTSTHKVRFATESMGSGTIINGDANTNETTFSFIRLGDT